MSDSPMMTDSFRGTTATEQIRQIRGSDFIVEEQGPAQGGSPTLAPIRQRRREEVREFTEGYKPSLVFRFWF